MTPAQGRRAWAGAMLDRTTKSIPVYGSPDWLVLPEGSVVKVAAVIRAAECWAREGDELEELLRLEVGIEREVYKSAEDADYVARRDAHKASWTGRGFRRDPADAEAFEAEWLRGGQDG